MADAVSLAVGATPRIAQASNAAKIFANSNAL